MDDPGTSAPGQESPVIIFDKEGPVNKFERGLQAMTNVLRRTIVLLLLAYAVFVAAMLFSPLGLLLWRVRGWVWKKLKDPW